MEEHGQKALVNSQQLLRKNNEEELQRDYNATIFHLVGGGKLLSSNEINDVILLSISIQNQFNYFKIRQENRYKIVIIIDVYRQ